MSCPSTGRRLNSLFPRRKPNASSARIATDMPMPSPTFAPVDRPPDGDGVSVIEGDAVGVTIAVPVNVWKMEDVAVARASTAMSDDCHMMGMPLQRTFWLTD
jgi:hypothetical protein